MYGHQLEVSAQKRLEHSMGSVLVGSLVALLYVSTYVSHPLYPRLISALSLSGAVWMQVFLYVQLYPRDRLRIKLMVRVSPHPIPSHTIAHSFSLCMTYRYSPSGLCPLCRCYGTAPDSSASPLTIGRVLDTIHSAMAITANWQYLIVHFGDWDTIDDITWCV